MIVDPRDPSFVVSAMTTPICGDIYTVYPLKSARFGNFFSHPQQQRSVTVIIIPSKRGTLSRPVYVGGLGQLWSF